MGTLFKIKSLSNLCLENNNKENFPLRRAIRLTDWLLFLFKFRRPFTWTTFAASQKASVLCTIPLYIWHPLSWFSSLLVPCIWVIIPEKETQRTLYSNFNKFYLQLSSSCSEIRWGYTYTGYSCPSSSSSCLTSIVIVRTTTRNRLTFPVSALQNILSSTERERNSSFWCPSVLNIVISFPSFATTVMATLNVIISCIIHLHSFFHSFIHVQHLHRVVFAM